MTTRENFTNQKRRIATEAECKAHWGGAPRGERFRCNLCGHRFKPGDGWRWVYAGETKWLNFIVCDSCDGDDVLDRWARLCEEFYSAKFWSLRNH